MTYKWIPGCGPSREALERMRAHFRKPAQAMGEAWFMSPERRFYNELAEAPIAEITQPLLGECLNAISSGISCFGHRQEWHEWFKYLLPSLIERPDERYAFNCLVEPTISAFMQVFWQGLDGEYPEFRDDVMCSLGFCLMSPELWIAIDNGGSALAILRWQDDDGTMTPSGWDAGEANGALSSMFFFCLKYLKTGEMTTWVSSLLAVEDPYWKGALMVWLLGAYDFLNATAPVPAQLQKTNPRINWDDSHTLGSRYDAEVTDDSGAVVFDDNTKFLIPANNSAFLSEVRLQLTPELILEWTDEIAAEAALRESLLNTPELLFDKLTKTRV